jgi:hypothetical protein
MDHPKDRSGISRRQFVRYTAGSAAGLGVAGALAGCDNTTTPIGANAAGPTGAAAELVVQKPTGPAGLPLPRPDNSVTWAITDANKPIADGRPTERGPLPVALEQGEAVSLHLPPDALRVLTPSRPAEEAVDVPA